VQQGNWEYRLSGCVASQSGGGEVRVIGGLGPGLQPALGTLAMVSTIPRGALCNLASPIQTLFYDVTTPDDLLYSFLTSACCSHSHQS
jgi:hypothetical protein